MARILVAAATLSLLAVGGPAQADDAADCDAGIEMIRAEQAKDHPGKVADTLKTALRVALREKGEKEYDECLDAVNDARKALGK